MPSCMLALGMFVRCWKSRVWYNRGEKSRFSVAEPKNYNISIAGIPETKWFVSGIWPIDLGHELPADVDISTRRNGVGILLDGRATAAWQAVGEMWKAVSPQIVCMCVHVYSVCVCVLHSRCGTLGAHTLTCETWYSLLWVTSPVPGGFTSADSQCLSSTQTCPSASHWVCMHRYLLIYINSLSSFHLFVLCRCVCWRTSKFDQFSNFC